MENGATSGRIQDVIVIGAGPAGLLTALILAKSGIAVTLIDKADKLDLNPRATHYSAPAISELIRAGVIKDMLDEGFHPHGVSWRKLNGEVIAALDADVLGDAPDRMVCLPLNKLAIILKRHLDQQSNTKMLFGHSVVGLGQDDHKAWVDVETPDGKKQLSAQYIVGCDGANSQIRRSLFGDWEFPGHTWDKQIVATNVSAVISRPVTFVSANNDVKDILRFLKVRMA